jgi:predicted transposase YbfD/YdcC
VHGDYQVFLGLDVGTDGHHAVALHRDGKRLHDAALANSEVKLRQVFDRLAQHGRVLVVVDQPATIGALPVAVARACGHQVAYLPGLAMRRIADLHPGSAKTDARDAYVIADAARTLPHTLRRVDVGDEALAELEVLVGFDDDLAGESPRISNRIRGLLTQIHPALERVLGPKVQHKRGRWKTETIYAITDLGAHHGRPDRLAGWIRGHWHVENKVHWVRDVTYDEDRSQIRTGTGAQVMAAIRNLVIATLRLAGVTNIAAANRHHARNPVRPLDLLGIT